MNEALRIVARTLPGAGGPVGVRRRPASLEQRAGRGGGGADARAAGRGSTPPGPVRPAASPRHPSPGRSPSRSCSTCGSRTRTPHAGRCARSSTRRRSTGTRYGDLVEGLAGFFAGQPGFGPDNEDLVTLLRSPAVAFPHSLQDQLEYIRRKFGALLGDLLPGCSPASTSCARRRSSRFRGIGPGPVGAPTYDDARGEVEAFSADRDWMPRVVMVAKNALVWLDQLSRAFGRPIGRLDQVPDEELDTLARRGFTALWLIGVWERSPASRVIKRRMGNPEAEASAYALADYAVAGIAGRRSGAC